MKELKQQEWDSQCRNRIHKIKIISRVKCKQ